MRSMSVLIMAGAIAGCTTAPPPPAVSERAQADYLRLIEGRVAGAAQRCLPTFTARRTQITPIGGDRVAFRVAGGREVYVNQIAGGGCSRLNPAFNTLVTQNYGANGLCSGDSARVVDLSTHTTIDSCVIGDFVPYRRP